MFMLSESESEKTGLTLRMVPDEQVDVYDPDKKIYEEDGIYDTGPLIPNFSRTGHTNRKSGYACNEYLCEDDSLRINMWVSTDAKSNRKNNKKHSICKKAFNDIEVVALNSGHLLSFKKHKK